MHLILNASLQATPLAALSRPIAGTIKNTLICTLPGSPKAVRENMAALLEAGVISHAIELVRGGRGDRLHAVLASEGVRTPSVKPATPALSYADGAPPAGAAPTPPLTGSASPSVRSASPHAHHHHDHDDDHGHLSPTPRSVLSHDPSMPGRPYWRIVEPRTQRSACCVHL